MKISGMEKFSLVDYKDKVACTVFTPGCNFRCPFCHNSGLVLGGSAEIISARTWGLIKSAILVAFTLAGII